MTLELAWCVGTKLTFRAELTLPRVPDRRVVRQAAHHAETAAGLQYHPVTTATPRYPTSAAAASRRTDASMPVLISGPFSLRGPSSATCSRYATKSHKPLMITEYAATRGTEPTIKKIKPCSRTVC